jgi:hypothetical protein
MTNVILFLPPSFARGITALRQKRRGAVKSARKSPRKSRLPADPVEHKSAAVDVPPSRDDVSASSPGYTSHYVRIDGKNETEHVYIFTPEKRQRTPVGRPQDAGHAAEKQRRPAWIG